MRHFRTVPLALAIAFALTSVLVAQDAMSMIRVAGELKKIDGKALTISTTVDKAAKDVVIVCGGETKFSREGDKTGAQVKFEDLQVRQQVRAFYTKADSVALTVVIAKPQAPDTRAPTSAAAENNAPPPSAISAKDLYLAYTQNPQDAKRRFEGQELTVTGSIMGVAEYSTGKRGVLLYNVARKGSENGSVICFFTEEHAKKIPDVQARGNSAVVKVRGVCKASPASKVCVVLSGSVFVE